MSAIPERLSVALAGRYRIERELGAGGMATVYLAQDLKHDRKVALKVLKPELAAVIGGARFLAEIRTTANLQHPHILPLHDSGEVDGSVFYVMPFVEGESLRDRLHREKQLPIDDAIRIAREVAGAVHYAHTHGVIHRDLKPENILLHDGHALVADFGIALAASNTAGTRMTETGMSLGTPTYMSPEQAMGERDITARSDVYALGCVVYEMLLGEPPFTGPTAQSIVAKVLSERPAPLRQRRDRIPPAVEAAVLTALEKLPADRFGSLAEFASALTAPGPVTTTTTGATPRIARRERPLAFAAGVAAGLAVASLGAWLLWPGASGLTTTASTQITFNGRSSLPAISPAGEFIAFVDNRCSILSDIACNQSLIVQATTNARPVDVLRNVTQLRAPRWTADGQAIVIAARLDSVRHNLFRVPRLGGVPNAIAPAGAFDTHATADSVVVVRRDAQSSQAVGHVISIATGQVADTVVVGDRQVDAVGWSPDGRFLALVHEYISVTIVDRDGSAVDSVQGAFRSTVRWTPDGSAFLIFVALPVKEDDLVRYDVDANGRIGDTPTVVMPKVSALLIGQFDVARRTGQVAFVSGVITIDLWTFELNAPDKAVQRTSGTTWYGNPAISPDGGRLYYQRGDALGDNLYVMVLPDSEEALTADRRPGGLSSVSVSRDHRRVLFARYDSGTMLGEFDVARRQARLTDWGARSGDVIPRPLGERGMLYKSTRWLNLRVVDSLTGVARQVDPPDSTWIGAFVESPDGLDVAVVLDRGGVKSLGIMSLTDGRLRELQRLDPDVSPGTLSWSDDGWIYLATVRLDEAPTLWRIRDGQPRLTRVMTLPAGCRMVTVTVATRAPRGACKSEDLRGDIWLAMVPGIRR